MERAKKIVYLEMALYSEKMWPSTSMVLVSEPSPRVIEALTGFSHCERVRACQRSEHYEKWKRESGQAQDARCRCRAWCRQHS